MHLCLAGGLPGEQSKHCQPAPTWLLGHLSPETSHSAPFQEEDMPQGHLFHLKTLEVLLVV